MRDFWAAIALGIIEGITEFLPVSSTGHLLLAEHWLPRHGDLFNTIIQCGAVLAVLVIFTERLKLLCFEWRKPEAQDFILKLAAAFIVTGAGGILLKKAGLKLPEESAPVAWATLIGGILFILVEKWLQGKPTRSELTWTMALAVGGAQLVAAVFPGTSRSGSTILVALALGLNRAAATEFSFLLGIPTLLSAGALQWFDAVRHPPAVPIQWDLMAAAFVTAAVTAFIAVKWLLYFVQYHTFIGFGWYRIILGTAILLWAR